MAKSTKKTKVKLPNDFERMIPEYHKGTPAYGEHWVRYQAALGLVKGKVVLDIASGSGYGTQLLAKTAKKVYGVDVNEKSVKYAQENFSARNVEYKAGDGVKIPLADKSVDIVITFETIEHIKDYKKFLSESKRVLKPGGMMVVSTPNELEFAEGNHFHLHEFEYDELKSLLHDYFKNIKSYFQGDWVYSVIGDDSLMQKETQQDIPTLQLAPIGPEQYLYFFLLCSDRKIDDEVKPLAAMSEHYSWRKIQEKEGLTRQHINNLTEIIDELSRVTKEQKKALKDRDEHIRHLEEQLKRIHDTPAYKVYRKARSIRRPKPQE
jgi:ubiquinone/menaquinone biosynthesis C-methylase UbiE